MFASETKIGVYYCKTRTHFAAYAQRYKNGGWAFKKLFQINFLV